MGRIEALEQLVDHIKQETTVAETMARGLGDNLADIMRTITGL